jgi:hypothetical protein
MDLFRLAGVEIKELSTVNLSDENSRWFGGTGSSTQLDLSPYVEMSRKSASIFLLSQFK